MITAKLAVVQGPRHNSIQFDTIVCGEQNSSCYKYEVEQDPLLYGRPRISLSTIICS